jgi:hypothetical protein
MMWWGVGEEGVTTTVPSRGPPSEPGITRIGVRLSRLFACLASPSLADTAPYAQSSANWAGYAATGAQFSQVSGSWVQPQANCDSGSGDAAFWIGIGGATQESSALEQAGTEVDCNSGSPVYSAWYELVPAAPVTIDLAVQPGDRISSTVGVDGHQVSIALTNDTTCSSPAARRPRTTRRRGWTAPRSRWRPLWL